MRVFATQKQNGKIILKVWSSKASFRANENWCDEKFLNVGTTEDLVNYEFASVRSNIVYTEDQQASRLLMQEAYFKQNLVKSTETAPSVAPLKESQMKALPPRGLLQHSVEVLCRTENSERLLRGRYSYAYQQWEVDGRNGIGIETTVLEWWFYPEIGSGHC